MKSVEHLLKPRVDPRLRRPHVLEEQAREGTSGSRLALFVEGFEAETTGDLRELTLTDHLVVVEALSRAREGAESIDLSEQRDHEIGGIIAEGETSILTIVHTSLVFGDLPPDIIEVKLHGLHPFRLTGQLLISTAPAKARRTITTGFRGA